MREPPPAEALIAELRQFAEDVANLENMPDVHWRAAPAEDAWSLTSVLCHLRDVEREVHQVRLERLLVQENAFLPGVVADAWADERQYEYQDGLVALAEFLAARHETLDVLKGLEPDSWQRRGQHAFFGATTIHELVYLMVQHDQAHWEQIEELLAQ